MKFRDRLKSLKKKRLHKNNYKMLENKIVIEWRKYD